MSAQNSRWIQWICSQGTVHKTADLVVLQRLCLYKNRLIYTKDCCIHLFPMLYKYWKYIFHLPLNASHNSSQRLRRIIGVLKIDNTDWNQRWARNCRTDGSCQFVLQSNSRFPAMPPPASVHSEAVSWLPWPASSRHCPEQEELGLGSAKYFCLK